MNTEYDVVVVGGGPAGLAAALCLGRARRSVLVIDSGRPRHAVAEGVHNFLTREGIPPAELRAVAWEQMRTYPTVDRLIGTVTSLQQRDERWTIETDQGQTVSAPAVLLATGVVDRHPEIPGYAKLWGRSIFHCPYCHGWEVRDQALAVLGHSPEVAQFAPLLRAWSSDVIVVTNGEPLPPEVDEELRSRSIEVRAEPITELAETSASNGDETNGLLVRFDGAPELARDALFVMSSPRLPDLVADLDLEIDAGGFVQIDQHGATSRPGLWAAGDLTSRRHQVVEAMAQGLRSAVAISRQLILEPVAR